MRTFCAKLLIIVSVLFVAAIGNSQEAQNTQDVSEAEAPANTIYYCVETFIKEGACPQEVCTFLECNFQDEDGNCIQSCVPKSCLEIQVEHCPLDLCQVLMSCSGSNVCFNQFRDEPLTCGGLAYAGEKDCCDGMVKRCGVEYLSGACDMEGVGSPYSVPICIPCGDGECTQFEDQCNCPEDCKEN